MLPGSLKRPNFLKVDKGRLGKLGRSIQYPVGSNQVAVK
jgi:hypothetical protein